jgi:hypothetical protein
MHTNRSVTYRKRWDELVSYYGSRCFYCHKEIATTIDHVVPYSLDRDNDIDNLVPACSLCNSLASDKIFEDAEQKRQYILGERAKRINQRAICINCLLPYAYHAHSPSLFLCAECYDEEYETKHSETREWKRWIRQLRAAGIPAEAHRAIKKKRSTDKIDHDAMLELLIDEYSRVIDSDDEFAEMLMTP